jgi:hypothetical protein
MARHVFVFVARHLERNRNTDDAPHSETRGSKQRNQADETPSNQADETPSNQATK